MMQRELINETQKFILRLENVEIFIYSAKKDEAAAVLNRCFQHFTGCSRT
jgi:hypothetical protein